MTTPENILVTNLGPNQMKTLVTTLGPKNLALLMRVVRRSRMGKVKRHGRKGHRTYTVYPRNQQEMPAGTVRFMELGVRLDAEANHQDR